MLPKQLILIPALLAIAIVHQPASAQDRAPDKKPDKPKAAEAVVADGNMTLKLRRGMTLSGTPVEMEGIKMNTLFGEATIPTHTIAGIRFGSGPGDQTTVVLRNGDALTGETALSQIKFVSAWGEATVNVTEVESIVFSSDLQWTSIKTPSGTRWQLNKVPPGMNRNNNSSQY